MTSGSTRMPGRSRRNISPAGDFSMTAAATPSSGEAASSPMAAAVTVEAVLAADPEAIVASGMGEERPEWLDEWRRWPALTAVGRNNLFFVHPDHLQRHTPRILDGIERLCEHLEAARARRPVK